MEPENTGPKQADTWFKPGQSGNPAGRPKGARSRLQENFLAALAEKWGRFYSANTRKDSHGNR